MNLLAHAYLTPSWPPDLLVGNLTADWIKGRARRVLPTLVQNGFELHRRIDGFADTHHAAFACADFLQENWGHYASILVDVFLDYALASEWAQYSVQPFHQFTSHVYSTLRSHLHLLPEHAQYASHMMIADDWLTAYSTIDGIRLTLTRMSSRLQSRGHLIELAPAANDLLQMRPLLNSSLHVIISDYQKLYLPPRAA